MRVLLPILLLLPWCAWADLDDGVQLDTVRCGRQVIQVGDRSWEIIEACGEPDYREVIELRQDRIELEQPDGEGTVEVGVGAVRKVEEWVYLPSSGRLTRIMTFVSGQLTDIRLLGRN